MKIKLVFDDWISRHTGKSIYATPKGMSASLNDFHSGSTFHAEIILNVEQEKDLEALIEDGFIPRFVLLPNDSSGTLI